MIDLYSRPEYISDLRKEVEDKGYDAFQKSKDGLPLLDSFLKESARLSAFESSRFLPKLTAWLKSLTNVQPSWNSETGFE